MLKFEGFGVGDKIRAFDFPPMGDRPDRFVEGTIKGFYDTGFRGYVIDCDRDSCDGRRVGQEVIVPMEVSILEFDERIQKVS